MQTSKRRVPSMPCQPKSGRSSVLLTILVFGLTATIVFRLGYDRRTPQPMQSTFSATATIVEKSQQASGEVKIPIEYSAADRQRAEQVAHALAAQYITDRNIAWQRQTAEPIAKTHETTENARQKLAEAQARSEAFKKQAAEKGHVQSSVPSQSVMVDNPAWLKAETRIQDIKRRRDALLRNRTAQHPAVLELQSQIDEAQKERDAIPRQIPGQIGETSPESTERQDDVSPRLRELAAQVEQARSAVEHAESLEKQMQRLSQSGPQYTLEGIEVVEIKPEPDNGWRRVLAIAFLAGLIMAFGIGTVSRGAAIEPAVATIEQVEAAAKTTILGTIPADDPVPDVVKRCGRHVRKRRALIALGFFCILACPLFVFWGMRGIY